MLRTKGKNL